ncbi:MAG: VWA domain-containing protein, partial [Desulfobacteraceae bacterium]|nr:VWA domain-containing protein [Desulfobacteraceae bacterium]
MTLPDYMARTLSQKPGIQTFENRKGLNLSGVKEDKDGQVTTFFTLFDQDVPGIKPLIENTVLRENGSEANIKSIEHVKTPADIVLLIDSSGSMKGQMAETIKAAKRFVSSLPDNTFIKVIDFDTKPKELSGQSKDEVLSGLAKIRADGATALYDSI